MASAFRLNRLGQIFSNNYFRLNYFIRRGLRNKIPQPTPVKSLTQILQEQNTEDPSVQALVDIGLPPKLYSDVELRKLKGQFRIAAKHNKELYQAAKSGSLHIDLAEVDKYWCAGDGPEQTKLAAQHYNIYQDLFHHGIFTPTVPLDIQYPFDDETTTKVYRGNVIFPEEATLAPKVTYPSDPDSLWTLVLTNIDGNLIEDGKECLHWFVGNIKGNDLTTGEERFPYLQPYPVRGVGYQRMVFILYLQDGTVDYSDVSKPSHKFNLKSRNFSTFDFYKMRQKYLTPTGLVFYQTVWDESIKGFFHTSLDMKEPVYEYEQPAKILKPQRKYPIKRPFNKYLERYRDIKDIKKQVLLMRLKTLNPFEEEPPMPKYPNIYKPDVPLASWQKNDLWKERNRIGKFKDLRPYSSYPQKEFSLEELYKKSVDNPE